LGTLNVASGATVVLPVAAAYSDHEAFVISHLTVAGTLNIGNTDLDLPGASLSAIQSLVASGYDYTGGASWNGTGITSSLAAGSSNPLTAVGVVQNNQDGSVLYGSGNLFGGIAPGASDILLKYTYVGDLNLDGQVDGSDYSLIDAGYAASTGGSGTTSGGWLNGDLNHDGVIDGSDYTLIDNAFNNQTAALKPAAEVATTTAVPTSLVASQKAATPAAAKHGKFGSRPITAAAVPPAVYATTPVAAGTFAVQSAANLLTQTSDWFDLLAAGKSDTTGLV
jgi:hypothetical protein